LMLSARVALILTAAGIIGGCGQTGQFSEEGLNGLPSLATTEEVEDELGPPEEITDTSNVASDLPEEIRDDPRFSGTPMGGAETWTYRESRGEYELEFVNDRLISTRYCGDQCD